MEAADGASGGWGAAQRPGPDRYRCSWALVEGGERPGRARRAQRPRLDPPAAPHSVAPAIPVRGRPGGTAQAGLTGAGVIATCVCIAGGSAFPTPPPSTWSSRSAGRRSAPAGAGRTVAPGGWPKPKSSRWGCSWRPVAPLSADDRASVTGGSIVPGDARRSAAASVTPPRPARRPGRRGAGQVGHARPRAGSPTPAGEGLVLAQRARSRGRGPRPPRSVPRRRSPPR